jgi:hypothetical protein
MSKVQSAVISSPVRSPPLVDGGTTSNLDRSRRVVAAAGSRAVGLVALGTLLYALINTAGYFTERAEWPMVVMFGILLFLTAPRVRTIATPLAAALLVLLFPATAGAQSQPAPPGLTHRHHLEVFPIVALFDIYSAQYGYRVTPRNELIVGFTYVNIQVSDRDDRVIGRFHAPTLPLGFRRYLWRNAHVEYQIWPAYNFYYDKVGERYHNGFDLYNEARAGYRIDFVLGGVPLFANAQYVYGFGLYPGNKPDNFTEAAEDQPVFHVPSLSIGLRF